MKRDLILMVALTDIAEQEFDSKGFTEQEEQEFNTLFKKEFGFGDKMTDEELEEVDRGIEEIVYTMIDEIKGRLLEV